ncbi:MAG: hypothetical protein IE928_10110 [Gammaproteobacteria bacterium]|nr:hypothetical protein [Gammaproteobacteria bacterium]
MALKNETLVNAAVAAFGKQTGLSIYPEIKNPESGSVQLFLEGGHEPFEAYVKATLTKQNLSSVIYEMSQESYGTLKVLVAPYINPNLMEELREAKVFCLDAAGNAFIQKLPLYVFIKGNKPTGEATATKKGRAFQYAGLKVVFALLQNPNLLHRAYREIAEKSGVALGSIGGVLDALVHQGYIRVAGKERIFQDRKGLLQRWVEEYPVLKQKHFIGSFTSDNPHWWKEVDIANFEGVWGGEIAADAYTNYLQAKDAVVFIPEEQKSSLLKSARLKKRKADKEGICIDLIEPFWAEGTASGEGDLAPPLLVYADLIHSRDARNLDTAKRIYEQYLD